MKKIIVILLTCVLALALLAGCGGGGTPSAVESSEGARKSSHTKSQAASSAAGSEAELQSGEPESDAGAADSSTESIATAGGAYEANGFKLVSAELIAAPEGVGGSPTDTSIVFLLNNVTDGTVTMSSDRADLLIFSAEYEVDGAVSGTLKLVVTDESGTEYIRENNTEFAASGANSFQALIKTKGALSGTYTLKWYIDDLLAGEAEFTK